MPRAFYVSGLGFAISAVSRVYRLVDPGSGFPRLLAFIAEEFATEATSVAHRVTGALGDSQMSQEIGHLEWAVFPDPSVINRFGFKPSIYGEIEERRGGTHAFYLRTIVERINPVWGRVVSYIDRNML